VKSNCILNQPCKSLAVKGLLKLWITDNIWALMKSSGYFAELTMEEFVALIYSKGSCVWRSTGNSLLLFQSEIKKYLRAVSY